MKWMYIIATFSCFIVEATAQPPAISGAIEMEFVRVPPGKFIYGTFEPTYPLPDSSEKYNGYRSLDYAQAKKMAMHDRLPGFEVNIKDSFDIGKYEVTQKQWTTIMGNNPSVFVHENKPVDNVSWYHVQAFLDTLNKRDQFFCYRLPTEFEWEYAARAGEQNDISWDEIRIQAQLGTTSSNEVGGKKPNAWGIYDMLGNVWEWTNDWYNGKIFADKKPPKAGSEHVLKGASFTGDVKNATYMTHAAGPGNNWDVGFRIVRERKEKQPKNIRSKSNEVRWKIEGWHVSRTSHQGTTPFIQYANDVFTLKQNPYGQGGVLLSNKKYRDFELTVDVKIDSFCNGGIFLRSSESGQAYQIELSEPGGTGNLFGEMMKISSPGVAEKKSEVWKPNNWNTFRIRMTGEVPRIILWINGVQMYDVTQPQNDFTAGATEGMIGFQVHWSATYSAHAKAFDMSRSWRPGGKHQFRNVRIREVTEP